MIYILLALPWAAILYYFGHRFDAYPLWMVFTGVVIFSLPVIMGSLYLTTVKKIHNLAGFESRGWLYRLFSGRILATLGWTIWASAGTFFMLLQFHAYTRWEWFAFLLVVPLFYLVYRVSYGAARGELKPYRQVAFALRMARRVTPVMALAIYVAVLWATGGPSQVISLGEAIALRKSETMAISGSALVHELLQFMAYYDGARLFIATRFGGPGTVLALLLLGLGGWIVFFNATAMLTSFLIPRHEYRRIFAPLSEADEPSPPEPARIVFFSAIVVIAVIFVGRSGFVQLEHHARLHGPAFNEARERIEDVVVLIDGDFYRPEVVQELQNLQFDMVREVEAFQPRIERSMEAGFVRMEDNVEPFLDWYYSFGAEYWRILKLFSGTLEDYLFHKLEEYLRQGDPFGEFQALVAEAIGLHAALQAQYAAEAEEIMARHKAAIPEHARLKVAQELSLATLLEFPAPEETIPFTVRAGTGGAISLVTVAVFSKVMANLSAKGVIHLAGAALSKALLTRTAGVAGGAAAGAAAGSIAPGLGTAAGAAIGAGVGIFAGAGIDYGMLKLEEYYQRDEFREVLLETIRETRENYLAELDNEMPLLEPSRGLTNTSNMLK